MRKAVTRVRSEIDRRKMNSCFSGRSFQGAPLVQEKAKPKVRQGISDNIKLYMSEVSKKQALVKETVQKNLKKPLKVGDSLKLGGKKKLTIDTICKHGITGRMLSLTAWNGNQQEGQYTASFPEGSSFKKTAKLAKEQGITVQEMDGDSLTEIGAALKDSIINLYASASSNVDQSDYKTRQETAIKNLSVGLTRSLDDAVGNSSYLGPNKMKDFVTDTISQVVGENLSSDDQDLNECMKAYASDKPYAIIDKIMDTIPKVIHRQFTDKFQKDTDQNHVGEVKSQLGIRDDQAIPLSTLNSQDGIGALSAQISNAPGMDVKSFLKAVFAEQSDVKIPDAILDKVAKACQDGQGESAIKDLMHSAHQVAELRGRIPQDASNINPDQIQDWMSALDNSHKGKSPKQKQEILADFSAIFAKTIGMASQRQKELQTTLTQKKPSTAKAMISVLHEDIENINQQVDKSRADIGNTARGLSIKGGRLQDNQFIEKLIPSTQDILKNIEIEGAGSHIWEPALEQVASALSDNLPSYMRFDAKEVVKNFIGSHEIVGKDVEDVTKRFLDVLKQNLEIQTGSPEDVKIIERGTGWGKDLKKACEKLNQGYCSQKDKDNFANMCEGFVEDYEKSGNDNSLLEGMLRHLGFDNQGIEEKQKEISDSGDLKNTVSNIVRNALNKERSIVPYRGDAVSDYFTTAKFSDRAAKQDALKNVILSGHGNIAFVTNELMNKVLRTEDADYNKALKEKLGGKFGELIGDIFTNQGPEDGLRLFRKIIRSATLLNSDKPEVQEQGEKKFKKLCDELRNNQEDSVLPSVRELLSSIVTAQHVAKANTEHKVIASDSQNAEELVDICKKQSAEIVKSLKGENGDVSPKDAMQGMREAVDTKKGEANENYNNVISIFGEINKEFDSYCKKNKLDDDKPMKLDAALAIFNSDEKYKQDFFKDGQSFDGIITDSLNKDKELAPAEWFNIMMSMAGDDKVEKGKEAAPRYAMKALTNDLAKQFVESWSDLKSPSVKKSQEAQANIKKLTQKIKDIISVGQGKTEWQQSFTASLRDTLADSMRKDKYLEVSQDSIKNVEPQDIQRMLSQAKKVYDNAVPMSYATDSLHIDLEDEQAPATLADKIMSSVLSRKDTDEEEGDLNGLISEIREQSTDDKGVFNNDKFKKFLSDVEKVWQKQLGGAADLSDLSSATDEQIVQHLKTAVATAHDNFVQSLLKNENTFWGDSRESQYKLLQDLLDKPDTKHLASAVIESIYGKVCHAIDEQKPQGRQAVDIGGEVNNVSEILEVVNQGNPEAATEYAQQALTSITDTLSKRYPQFKEAMTGVVEEFKQDIKGDGQEKAPLSGAEAFAKVIKKIKEVRVVSTNGQKRKIKDSIIL